MPNLADQPLIPCPSIAKYWQSYITEMTTWWQNQAKSSEMSETQLLSSVRILLVQSPDYPPSQSTFIEHSLLCHLIRALWHCKPSFKAYLLMAEVGVDAEKDAEHKKISFQSVESGSNFTFLFTLSHKRCNMTAMFQLMQIPNSGTPSLKCSMNKNESPGVLNNWTVSCTWLWSTRKLRWESKTCFSEKPLNYLLVIVIFYIILPSDYLHLS